MQVCATSQTKLFRRAFSVQAAVCPLAPSTSRPTAASARVSSQPGCHHLTSPCASSQPPRQQRRCSVLVRAEAEPERKVVYNKEFGYSRKDVLIIIVALLGAGILMYEGLQAAGMDAGMAGNWVQLIIFLGICVGWVSTYIWRVSSKNMTYAQQLRMYEEAVIQKRLEEMTEAELQQLLEEVDAEKEQSTGRLLLRKAQERKQQQQQQGQ